MFKGCFRGSVALPALRDEAARTLRLPTPAPSSTGGDAAALRLGNAMVRERGVGRVVHRSLHKPQRQGAVVHAVRSRFSSMMRCLRAATLERDVPTLRSHSASKRCLSSHLRQKEPWARRSKPMRLASRAML
jgi:hypothetical protein